MCERVREEEEGEREVDGGECVVRAVALLYACVRFGRVRVYERKAGRLPRGALSCMCRAQKTRSETDF